MKEVKEGMRTVFKILLSLAVFVVLFLAFSVWSGWQYEKQVAPSDIDSIAGYFQRFGEPYSVDKIELNGSTYYRVRGQFPNSVFSKLALPSSRPLYLFDQSGRYVDWCTDPAERDYAWPKGSNYKGTSVDMEAFKKQFGIIASVK